MTIIFIPVEISPNTYFSPLSHPKSSVEKKDACNTCTTEH